jgi:hypothetical protein
MPQRRYDEVFRETQHSILYYVINPIKFGIIVKPGRHKNMPDYAGVDIIAARDYDVIETRQ